MKDQCYTCRYYAKTTDWFGECRLATPIADFTWPKVGSFESCGEHDGKAATNKSEQLLPTV